MFEQYPQPDSYQPQGYPPWVPPASLTESPMPVPPYAFDAILAFEFQPLFIGHGKDEVSLTQLRLQLEQANVQYKIARDEANMGRTVLDKVLDTMRLCKSGIFLFTDDGYRNPGGEPGPNSNVMGELGTALKQYPQNKIIIVKEKGITLPSNYGGLVYIEFERGYLSRASMEIRRELMAFGAKLPALPLLAARTKQGRGPTGPPPEVSPTPRRGPL